MTFELVKEQLKMFKGYIMSIENSIENVEQNYKNNYIIRKRCLKNGYNNEFFFLHCRIMILEIRKILKALS